MNLEFYKKHKKITRLLLDFTNLLNLKNKIKNKKGNRIKKGCVLFRGVKIYFRGKGNLIEIGDFCRLSNCKIYVYGNNNTIKLGERNYLNKVDLYVEDDNNSIILGNHNSIEMDTHLDAIEGTSIIIGDDCMFSRDINIRTGDGHSILDLKTFKRINTSKNVNIGNHVWIGMRTIFLKGTSIGDNCVVGASAIVTKRIEKSNVVVAGNPATIIKENIDWKRERN